VTEMSNIQTSVPSNTFDLPTGLNKIDANQVRTQVDAMLKALLALTQNMTQSSGTTTTTATPSVSPTPAQ